MAVKQQSQKHAGRILRAARAPVVDLDAAQIHLPDRVQNEMSQMAWRQPIAQIGGRISGVP
jgi:hypothetical protein